MNSYSYFSTLMTSLIGVPWGGYKVEWSGVLYGFIFFNILLYTRAGILLVQNLSSCLIPC